MTGEFLLVYIYDEQIGSIAMNPLIFICALLLILLLSGVLFASSIKLFFNTDELNEMGVCLGPLEMQLE